MQFVPQVADSLDDAGLGNAIVVDKDGIPYVSSFSFFAKLGPNDIPVSRPVTVPTIPSVAVDSLSSQGYWQRGAAAMPSDIPISIAFGPQTIASLANSTADNTNGTDIALDADGGLHVVWTAQDGVWYAERTSSSFTAELVRQGAAGQIGRPAVAVGADGTPWVAFTENAATGQQVVMLSRPAGTWQTQVVAATSCTACAAPGHTGIEVNSAGLPVVAFVDAATGSVDAVTVTAGGGHTQTTVGSGGEGLSMTADSKGSLAASYYSNGSVVLATSADGGSWSTSTVADAKGLVDGQGNAEPTTGVALQDDGSTWVAWQDGDGVHMAGGTGGSLDPVTTRGTEGGTFPSVGASGSGDNAHVFLAWYEPVNHDLIVGVQQDASKLDLVAISPTPQAGAPASQNCGDDKTVQLDEAAKNLAFTNACLVAASGKPFSISFDNQDAATQHNLTIAKTADDLANPLAASDTITGPAKTDIQVGVLDPGSYFFECTIHPTTMTGTLVVVKGAS